MLKQKHVVKYVLILLYKYKIFYKNILTFCYIVL
nr:MAG TPA: hypothetical protein [Caudoviricetes sp.]